MNEEMRIGIYIGGVVLMFAGLALWCGYYGKTLDDVEPLFGVILFWPIAAAIVAVTAPVWATGWAIHRLGRYAAQRRKGSVSRRTRIERDYEEVKRMIDA
jgi:hypothetical protein